jgi:hypothetical protein
MESLESKLDRLTPEQRREAEDFVDFLLQRQGGISVTVQINPPQPPPPLIPIRPVPPPLSNPEHAPATEPHPFPMPEMADEGEQSALSADEPYSPIRETGAGSDDVLTHGYKDYGEYEQPSPVPEAVIRVKHKKSHRKETEKSGHLLDWID